MPMAASISTSSLSVVGTNLSLPPHRHHRHSSISTPFRTNRFFLSSSLAYSSPCDRRVVHGGLGLRRNTPDVWKHYSAVLSQPTAPVRQSCTSCCLASAKKRRSNLPRFVPGAFF
ncbi:unnamed protein product [Lathyrus sativus]|nr:unnamed protein product [Lathyrus sativus]